jgi:tRNA-(ms[2]io[6]A)-hydroxylase
LIEARSCERFELLAPLLPEPMASFYASLAESEKRHAGLYLDLAAVAFPDEEADGALWDRLESLADHEAQLVLEPDPELRFHSGAPSMAESGLTAP